MNFEDGKGAQAHGEPEMFICRMCGLERMIAPAEYDMDVGLGEAVIGEDEEVEYEEVGDDDDKDQLIDDIDQG